MTTDQTSSIHLATAWDDTPAFFNTIQRRSCRTRLKAAGASADLSVQARPGLRLALNAVDWYRKIYKSTEFGDDIATLHQRCPDYYPG